MQEGGNNVCEVCGKTASMTCPTCMKLGLPPSMYCSQACFQGQWSSHKGLHKMAKLAAATASSTSSSNHSSSNSSNGSSSGGGGILPVPPEFNGYSGYTGSLRPHPRSARRSVPDRIRKPDYATHPGGRAAGEETSKRAGGNGIRCYTPGQIKGMREACRAGREVLDIAGKAVKVGVTCDEIDRVVHEACLERDCYPSPLNYYTFPKSVCTSVNEVICHGIPDMYELKDGDIVNVDVTTYTGAGFHGDLNETFLVGNVDDDSVRLVETAFACLSTAVAMVRPGTMYRDVGNEIHKVASAAGCQVVKTYCGHGIGDLFHTTPNVPHYRKNKAKGIMKAGHIFTIEPMINLGGFADSTWPDNWTAVTRDGSRSAQFEHTLLVTETGYDILTARDDEPVMKWNRDLVQR